MKKVKLIEEFNTKLGKTLIIDKTDLVVGEDILINNLQYTVKQIVFNSRPTKDNRITIIV